MKKNKDNLNNKNQEKKEPFFDFKRSVIAVLTLFIFILAFGPTIKTSFQTPVSYNTFMQQVQNEQIKEADINKKSGKVSYTLKENDNKIYYTNYSYNSKFIETLLINNVKIKIHEESWLVTFLRYGGTTVVFLLFLYFVFIKQGTFDFNVEPIENIKIRFSDIAGMKEIKEDMLLISEMMKESKYRESGARIPRGILLQGPPGNGKTLLARAFAGETGVNFIAVNACDFGSQFVGVGSNKIKKVFETAKKNAPCVIFIDELDSVGAKRSTSQDAAGKEMNTMLTALLNQMDGFEPMDNVMVLAATNRVEDLDDALIRPGRFDRQFVISYPDKKTRKEIFELYSKDVVINDNVNFDELALRTYGYSCSKIECVVNEAIINSIKRESETVDINDFNNAILFSDIKGHLKTDYDKNKKEREITAYHEAGHAVLGYLLTNEKITHITIIPTTSGAGGFTLSEDTDECLKPIEEYKFKMAMMYGGRASEVLLLGGDIENATTGASEDIHQITLMASNYIQIRDGIDYSVFDDYGIKQIMNETKNLTKEVWNIAFKTAKKNWAYINEVAKYLLENDTMDNIEFEKIMKKNIKSFH